jgi:hypothetical protein
MRVPIGPRKRGCLRRSRTEPRGRFWRSVQERIKLERRIASFLKVVAVNPI